MKTYAERIRALRFESWEPAGYLSISGFFQGTSRAADIAAEADERIAELEAEVARMRTALESICGHMQIVAHGFSRHGAVYHIAKDALNPNTESEVTE